MDRKLKPATKLTVFVGGDERYAHQSLHDAVLHVLRELGIVGATLTRGVMSYGVRRRVRSGMNEVTMENLPIIIEAVDEGRKIVAAAERIAEMLGVHGLVQLQPTLAVHTAADGERMEE